MIHRVAWLLGLAAVIHVSAQTIPYAAGYKFGGLIPMANGWEGADALDLVSPPGGRTGKVWLRQTPDGLLVFARFGGGEPKYARFPAEMDSATMWGCGWRRAIPWRCRQWDGPTRDTLHRLGPG